jgi:hypothetical protein
MPGLEPGTIHTGQGQTLKNWLHGASSARTRRLRMPAKKKQKQAAESGKAVKPKKKKTSRGK